MPLLKPTIQLNPTSLTFNAVQGGSNPSSQDVTVKNIGPLGSTLNWSATDNAAWVSESPTSGSLGSGASENTTVSVNITGLTAGTYYATITVSDPNATNDPQTVSVTLVITAPKPTIGLSPTSLTFNAVQGGSNPSSQIVTVTNIGPAGSTLNWTATDDADWLSESPTGGSLASGASEPMTVSVNITGLTAGTYYATITVSDPNATNDPQTVSVTLVVTAPVSENVKLHPDNVLDNTSCSLYLLTALERGKLENSDNSRYTNKYYWGYSFDNSKYIEFRFPDIPAGATVNSVVLKFEWQRTWEVDNARLRIWDGSTWVIRYLTPLPNAGTDRTENIDLKDLYGINTAAKVNGLKIQFQATDGSGAGTSIDWVEVQVNYTP
jgi:hypothetical protein